MHRKPPREVSAARADIRHRLGGFQAKRHHHLVRLLPGVALRVFQNPDVFFGGTRRVVLVRHLSKSGHGRDACQQNFV
jgi:2-keto-3-deoxy-galactonokinase